MVTAPWQSSPRQLSRPALLYLLAALAGCTALLAPQLPAWVSAVAAVAAAWRLLVFSGRLSFPPVWLKNTIVLACGAGLYAQYGHTISMDVFVALLLLGFSLRVLEVYHQPAAQGLLYLAFFVLMTFFLYVQEIAAAAQAFLQASLVLAALVAMQASPGQLARQPWAPLRLGGIIAGLAVPVMLVMFVVMPRIPPLWVMPLQKQQQARTGMGAEMSPGDFSKLTGSRDVVMRASFSGALPPVAALYWLGLRLDTYDGTTWRAGCDDCDGLWQRTDRLPPLTVTTGWQHYQLILEPHGDKWLFALPDSRLRDADVLTNGDGLFRFRRVLDQRVVVDALWQPGGMAPASAALVLAERDRQRYLALPPAGDARARALAAQWRAAMPSPRARVDAALDYYHATFEYTLEPPLLQGDRIDDFLFRTRSGFCEHFAGSFVYLMRAAGVPARVVLGYLGGEKHTSGYYIVRQYDAHAWAEVWLDGQGWVRVDPTAAVAPERIRQGFDRLFADSPVLRSAFGLDGYRDVGWLNRIRLQLDYADYLWARWVLGYEGEVQQQLLQSLGMMSPWRIVQWVGGFFLAVLVLLYGGLYWLRVWRATEPPAVRAYRALCHAYARYGLVRDCHETPRQFGARVQAAGAPCGDAFREVSESFYAWCYLHDADGKPLPGVPVRAAADPLPVLRRLAWRLRWQALNPVDPRR